jgi:hypothetical protein
VAHYLSPRHVPIGTLSTASQQTQQADKTHIISADDRDDTSNFLEHYAGREARFQFSQFRGKQGIFCSTSRRWDLAELQVKFWEEHLELVPELAHFALRLFHIPGKWNLII